MKIAVLDANAYWTRALYSHCGRFADVLLLQPRDFRAHRTHAKSFWSDEEPRQLSERIWVQKFSMLPGWMVELWPWSRRKLARAIRAFAASDELTLVIGFPQYRGIISAVNPAVSVYHNYDDYVDNWPRYRKHMAEWEGAAARAVDIIICSAAHRKEHLARRYAIDPHRIHHLSHGCSREFMTNEPSQAAPTGAKSKNVEKTVGYVGALNYRFDFGFLAEVAVQFPDVRFLLGGRVVEDGDPNWLAGLEEVRRLGNVQFIGWVEHARLSSVYSNCDVLIMTYARCNFNAHASPMKLWDYLGTGKPIVANDANPETLLWRRVVRIGATPAQFAEKLQEALHETDGALREERLDVARANTWEKLSEKLERIVVRSGALHTKCSV
jgi:glycosyltransferase involved in cell wall biosynthesis